MPRYNTPVLRRRGISEQDCDPSAPSLTCARDLVLHLLLARIATGDNGTTEVETLYNPKQNALDIEIPEDILQMLETIGIGVPLQRFMDWIHPLSGLQLDTIAIINSDHTPTTRQYSIMMTTGDTDRTVTLPAALEAGEGRVYVVKKVDSGSGTVIIVPTGGELIDGLASQELTGQWDALTFICDSAAWYIL